jgi:hypothetical protein
VVLKTEENKVINILLNKFGALLIFDWPSTILITGIKNALGHKDFNDIKEGWVAIQIESDFV